MDHIKRERKGQLWERGALYFHREAFPEDNDDYLLYFHRKAFRFSKSPVSPAWLEDFRACFVVKAYFHNLDFVISHSLYYAGIWSH